MTATERGLVYITLAVLLLLSFTNLLIIVSEANREAAKPARLIGHCDGQLFAAMEEDHFPEGCDWIEVIRYES